MTLPRVVVSRAVLPGTGTERLAEHVDLVRPTHQNRPEPAELQRLAEGATALLCLGNDTVDEALLDAAGDTLQAVSLASMGLDGVDTAAAGQRGVVVTNTPGVLAETTADLAFALILLARRRLVSASDSLRAGDWQLFRMADYLGLDVHGATLGLIGYGQIGRAVARRASGFGMRIIHHDAYATNSDELSTAVDFEPLLRTADIVSLHIPLTPETQHLIGADQLALMRPTATLINTSRGGVVDEDALLAALADGTIHSAGLDVFETEPLGQRASKFAGADRLVTLPHIGSATEATRAAMVDLAVDNILDVVLGNPARTPIAGGPAVPKQRSLS
ncbi:2-hydroxyacid dehydrogenase [Kribbella sp. NPDC050124]|uniref:2-hydroxyacid dehydrogenase n=1 Tax=Kribbella sp. NPDC050124 TaxID=3364114 RepID=UPI003793F561